MFKQNCRAPLSMDYYVAITNLNFREVEITQNDSFVMLCGKEVGWEVTMKPAAM